MLEQRDLEAIAHLVERMRQMEEKICNKLDKINMQIESLLDNLECREDLLKMVIIFDEEKVEREGKYNLKKMYASINQSFTKAGLKVESDGVYWDNGGEEDLNEFMVLASALSSQDWFVESIKRWDWYQGDLREPENLIKTFELSKRGSDYE